MFFLFFLYIWHLGMEGGGGFFPQSENFSHFFRSSVVDCIFYFS